MYAPGTAALADICAGNLGAGIFASGGCDCCCLLNHTVNLPGCDVAGGGSGGAGAGSEGGEVASLQRQLLLRDRQIMELKVSPPPPPPSTSPTITFDTTPHPLVPPWGKVGEGACSAVLEIFVRAWPAPHGSVDGTPPSKSATLTLPPAQGT